MSSHEPILKMENISKDFYGNKVLENINFSLNKGEILGLVGENGAGKSTLMNILFGMTVITNTGGFSGKIMFNGNEVRFSNPFDALDVGIGMVHQEFSLLPGFTAVENIVLNRESEKYTIASEIFGNRLNVLDREDMQQRADKSIKTLGINLDSSMLIADMPVGHCQFTEIAREIDRKNTKLLVLDEPTAVLTESEAEILLDSLRNLAKNGISIIFISHRLHEVKTICDKIIILRDGRVIKDTLAKNVNIDQIAELMVGRQIKQDAIKTSSKKINESDIHIEVKNLWVDMPGETVRNVSFKVKRGEIFGIGGLAGQGKLGIPNGIMGLYPAGGEVYLNGKQIPLNDAHESLSNGLGFVSEDRRGVGLLLEEPIEWNIAFTAMQVQNKYLKTILGGLTKIRDENAMKHLADTFIDSLEIKCTDSKQKVQELSGGNQQKICLAKSFALNPDILIVSEPTRGIDVGAKKLVLDNIRKQNEEFGKTIIMISSELEELRSICDRIALVNEGKITGILKPDSNIKEFGLLMAGEKVQA